MKIFPRAPQSRVPLSDRVWGSLFGIALIAWSVVFVIGAVSIRVA
jgi:hypothetical protein